MPRDLVVQSLAREGIPLIRRGAPGGAPGYALRSVAAAHKPGGTNLNKHHFCLDKRYHLTLPTWEPRCLYAPNDLTPWPHPTSAFALLTLNQFSRTAPGRQKPVGSPRDTGPVSSRCSLRSNVPCSDRGRQVSCASKMVIQLLSCARAVPVIRRSLCQGADAKARTIPRT